MALRGYQKEAVDRLFEYWDKRKNPKPCIIVASTGSGKSHMIAEIVRRLDTNVLVLQPSAEILAQNKEKLINEAKVSLDDIAVCSASAGSWKINKITLATIKTIRKRALFCQRFGTVIVDECDVCNIENADGEYMDFFTSLYQKPRIVGLTATPFRNQIYTAMYEDPEVHCRPLTRIPTYKGDYRLKELAQDMFGKFFWSGGIIYNIEMESLISENFLAKTHYEVAETDWSFVHNVPGTVDFETRGMEKWCDIESNTSRFTQAVSWCIRHNFKTIVFSPNIDMNMRLANVINSLGGEVMTMDSLHDSRKSRLAKMNKFKETEGMFLVNVGMLGRGVDVPSVDAVILARPTKSLSVYTQQVGRCLRIDPNKPVPQTAWVLDLAGNKERFGNVEDVKVRRIKYEDKPYPLDSIILKKNGKLSILDLVS